MEYVQLDSGVWVSKGPVIIDENIQKELEKQEKPELYISLIQFPFPLHGEIIKDKGEFVLADYEAKYLASYRDCPEIIMPSAGIR